MWLLCDESSAAQKCSGTGQLKRKLKVETSSQKTCARRPWVDCLADLDRLSYLLSPKANDSMLDDSSSPPASAVDTPATKDCELDAPDLPGEVRNGRRPGEVEDEVAVSGPEGWTFAGRLPKPNGGDWPKVLTWL